MGIKHAITRCGVEEIARQVPFVASVRSYDSAQAAVDATMGEASGVLILPLTETLPVAENWSLERRESSPKLLSLVDVPNVEEMTHTLDACSDGFLSMHDFTVDTLADAITRVYQGEIPIPSELTRALLADAHAGAPRRTGRPTIHLTRREAETLDLLVHGLSNKQIATKLTISEHGAKRLVANVLAKLNAPNRTSAVARALREQLCMIKDTAGAER